MEVVLVVRRVLIVAVGSVLALTVPAFGARIIVPTATDAAADPTIAAAGDIGCAASDPNYNGGKGTAAACRMKYTSDLLVSGGYTGVLTLGDNMQADASPSGFATVFNSTWGRVKALTHPEVGNHDYGYAGAKGYYGYFGAAAGDPTSGYYSFDIGAWHIVALNSNCAKISGGCARGGSQESWLRADLAAHPGVCTLAFDHHARYSSGYQGDNTFMTDLYQDLYTSGADVLLSGHSHDYERFNPQNNASQLDLSHGISQFVVGTGGAFFTGFGSRHPNSAASQNSTFGVLALTLHSSSYDWKFQPEAGKTWTDNGSRACHSSTPAVNDFLMTASPSAVAIAAGQSTVSTISTTQLSGSAESISLAASGLPVGATASFSPSNVSAGGAATMTIATSPATPTGTSSVTVKGTGVTMTHSTTLALTVAAGSSLTPQLVQSVGATETAAATSLTATLPNLTGPGHLLVLTASVHTGTTNRISSVTDSAGNTWRRVAAYSVPGHYSDGEQWYAANASSTTSVTAHTASAAVVATSVMEFSGVATIDPLGATTGTSNTSTSANSGSITSASSNELVIGFVAGHGNGQVMTITAPGYSTQAQQTSVASTIASVVNGYRVVPSGSALDFAATFGASMYWSAGIAAFRAAAGP